MKCTIIIGENETDEVIIHARQKNDLVKEIERLATENENLYGYRENEIISLNFQEIYAFIVEENKIYAITEKDKLLIKSRHLRKIFLMNSILNQLNILMISMFLKTSSLQLTSRLQVQFSSRT